MSTSEPIILWGIGASPFVRKVQIALVEKQQPYTQEPILPTSLATILAKENSDAFLKASPLGKIPALQIGTYCLADSTVICAYLDKKFSKGTKLYPDDPEAYGKTRWFENYADTILTEIVYKKIFIEAVVKPNILGLQPDNQVIEHAKQELLPTCLAYLETATGNTEWIAGNFFSMADIALITHFISLQQANFCLDKVKWMNLYKYIQRVIERPSVKTFSNFMTEH